MVLCWICISVSLHYHICQKLCSPAYVSPLNLLRHPIHWTESLDGGNIYFQNFTSRWPEFMWVLRVHYRWRNRDSKIEISRFNFLIATRFTSHSYVNVSQRLHIFSEFKFKQSVGSLFLGWNIQKKFLTHSSIFKNKTKSKFHLYLFKAFLSKGMIWKLDL